MEKIYQWMKTGKPWKSIMTLLQSFKLQLHWLILMIRLFSPSKTVYFIIIPEDNMQMPYGPMNICSPEPSLLEVQNVSMRLPRSFHLICCLRDWKSNNNKGNRECCLMFSNGSCTLETVINDLVYNASGNYCPTK